MFTNVCHHFTNSYFSIKHTRAHTHTHTQLHAFIVKHTASRADAHSVTDMHTHKTLTHPHINRNLRFFKPTYKVYNIYHGCPCTATTIKKSKAICAYRVLKENSRCNLHVATFTIQGDLVSSLQLHTLKDALTHDAAMWK